MTCAIVLAGGLGTRLRSVVSDRPKAMSRVAGRPFLEHVLGLLRERGVDRTVLAIGYRGEAIREHFGDGSRFGMKIVYSNDGERLLGTGGAVKRALGVATANNMETIFVVNGDTYVEFDFQRLDLLHRARKARLTIVAAKVEDVSRYRALAMDAQST